MVLMDNYNALMQVVLALVFAVAGSAGNAARKVHRPKLFRYSIVNTFPHDEMAFTQGLQYHEECDDAGQCKEFFWESTGMNGRSTVRKVELQTGTVVTYKALAHEDFGEGVTRHGDRLYQVIWMKPTVYSYHVDNFQDVKKLSSQLNDGWGITSDGKHLIITDSSPTIAFVNPITMQTQRTIQAQDGSKEIRWVNEIEWINGTIWGNVWQTECLVQIDPDDGHVLAWAVFEGITQHATNAASNKAFMDVFNGVAWDEGGNRLFVTGKQWPLVYEVVLHPHEVAAEEYNELHRKVLRACTR